MDSLLNFDFYALCYGFFFGIVGYAAWRYGRKTQSTRHIALGILLMGYSYLVPNPWASFFIGLGLTVLLFWP